MRQSMRFSAAGLGVVAGLISVLAFQDSQAEQPTGKVHAATVGVVEKPANPKPADQKTTAQKPADLKAADQKPVDQKAAAQKAADQKPAAPTPAPAAAKPAATPGL